MNEQVAISLFEKLAQLYHDERIVSAGTFSNDFLNLIGDVDDLLSNIE